MDIHFEELGSSISLIPTVNLESGESFGKSVTLQISGLNCSECS